MSIRTCCSGWCSGYAFVTRCIIFLTLCNVVLFVIVLRYLTDDPQKIDTDESLHYDKLAGNPGSPPATPSEWDVQERKADRLTYSNIWFVLAPGFYAALVSPDNSQGMDQFVQLRTNNAKTRGLGILAMCVTIAVVSTFKHAFEASTMYPDDPDLSDPNPDANRLYCEITSGNAWSEMLRGERDAAYVYACLPELWATKIDWLVARVGVYSIMFMVSGFPEAVSKVWSEQSPHLHAFAQTMAFSFLGFCVLMDVSQTVQSTTESAWELAQNSMMFSIPGITLPWICLYITEWWQGSTRAWNASVAVIKDPKLNLKSRTFMLCINLGMGYWSWNYEDDKHRIAHMAWHFFSGVGALISLTLTVDWDGLLSESDKEEEKRSNISTALSDVSKYPTLNLP